MTGRRAQPLHAQVNRLYEETSLRAEVAGEPDVADVPPYQERARSVELQSRHFVPLEAPDALAAALEEFLDA